MITLLLETPEKRVIASAHSPADLGRLRSRPWRRFGRQPLLSGALRAQSGPVGCRLTNTAVHTACSVAFRALGWVTFIGGAILWIHFDQAGIPAAEAVAKVPTGVLIASGAEFLVIAVPASLVTIGLLFLLDSSKKTRITVAGAALVLATFFLAVFVEFGRGNLAGWGYGAIVVLSALTGLVGGRLFKRTKSFPILALFSFIAVPLVFAVATYARAHDAPQVEPVALLRADGTPLVGFLVAETSDRVSVGTFREKARETVTTVPPRLLSLPTADVKNLTIGPRLPLNARNADKPRGEGEPRTAREWSAGAALILCDKARAARHRARASRTPTKSLPVECAERDIGSLKDFAKNEQVAIEKAGKH